MNYKNLTALPLRNLPLTALVLVYVAFRFFYFHNLPIWDAQFYYKWILAAQAAPFDLLRYSDDHHNAQAWLLLAGIPNYVFPASYYAYNVWIAFLGTTGIIAFYLIVTELTGDTLTRNERCLITALFAFHPSVLSSQIHTTLDTGVSLFSLWYLLALLKGRRLLAGVLGCCLLFTQETALMHLVIIYLFCMLLEPAGSRIKWAFTHKPALLFPLGGLVLFLFYKKAIRHQHLFLLSFLKKKAIYLHITPTYSMVNYLLVAFSLNFNWIISGLGIILTIIAVVRLPVYKKWTLAFTWFFLSTLVAVLLVRDWSNVHYLLPLLTVMLFCIAYLLPVIANRTIRLALLIPLLVLLVWQNFRTIDPVSKASFCVTDFGSHSLLEIPPYGLCKFGSYTPGWFARDLVVYNLQFTHFPLLFLKMIRDVHPTSDTVFVADWVFNHDFLTGFDSNYAPVFANATIQPKFLDISDQQLNNPDYITSLPDDLYYLAVPCLRKSQYRQFLSANYNTVQVKPYNMGGYRANLIHYSHKKILLKTK